jgi:hypothetical protein
VEIFDTLTRGLFCWHDKCSLRKKVRGEVELRRKMVSRRTMSGFQVLQS